MKPESAPRLRLFWLGHPRIELDGSGVRLETRKAAALLAYLSLSELPQSREKLAAFFWPEFDQSRAPANLRRSLASLNLSISGSWLKAERDRISLRQEADVWIDVRTARRLIADVKAHAHDTDNACPECLYKLAEALQLFQGDFLEGFNLPDCPEFDDWQTAERENLKAGLGWLLERSARCHAAAGRWEEAIQSAKRWVKQDRIHEEAQSLLIRLLALSGQRSAAVRQYEEFAEALRDEFGQEPDEGTRELYNRILSRQVGPPEKTKETPQTAARGAEQLTGLLGTKLTVPPLREGTVGRARLISLLEQGLRRGLVIVSAPAGFGKTTILSEFIAQTSMPAAWLSLDEGDNDLQRFLLHLAASLVKTDDGLGEEAGQMLQVMPPAPAELVMTAIINAIQEQGKTIGLVLDDYQFIHALEVHAAVRFLVEHRPLSLAIIIATRADPPFPLARLRSQDSVAEIRAEDLRFTAAEAGQFFDRAMSLSLTEDQVAVLERRTEGWAAGLQMAALSLQGRDDVDGFIASFTGTHHYILDYLAEEVFSRQDDDLTQFLLDTSILSRMSAGLCDAVTGLSGCGETLRKLERMNLFLVPLDEQREWYRYHHLFADLLRHKLKLERNPEKIRDLHIRAGGWYAGQGEYVEAIQEYLAAGACEKAADLIEEKFYEIISRGALNHLQRWGRDIPAEVMEKRPGYRLAVAWTLAWAGRRKEAEDLLDLVEKSISAGGFRIHEGTVAVIRAVLADMAGETSKAIELAGKADRDLPAKNDLYRTVIYYIIEKSYFYQGDLEKAEESCETLMRACNDTGSIWSISVAVCEYSRLRGIQGRRREGQKLLEDFDALAVRRRVRGSGPIAKNYAILAEFKRERGELEEARMLAEKAAKDVDAWGLPSDVYITHQYYSRVLRSCGQAEKALEELAKVETLPRRALVWATLRPAFEADKVKTLLALGDTASAEAWIDEYRPGKAEDPVNREIELTSLARIRLAAGVSAADCADLSKLLCGLALSARSGGRIGPLIAILLLRAKAEAALSAEGGALGALDEAVRLAQPEEYLYTFLEEGPVIADLLRRGRELGMWSSPPAGEYVRGLISAFDGTVTRSPSILQ